ncbi:MAG: hypothetical protein MJZ05_01105 [Fibrobacter sp.]|nr:hypothetical protein [Fibrobacter sp.]
MKCFFIFVFALILFACSDEPPVSQVPENYDDRPDFGWRKGDFIPVLHDSKMYGGLESIYHVDDRIILVDNHWSSNQYTSPGSVTYTPRVFASKIGSTHWDTLKTSEWIRYVYGDSTGLYAGTQLSGKVLKYDFDRSIWDELYKLPFDSLAYYNVYGIAIYQGRPIVCFAGYEDSTDKRNETIKIAYKMQTDTGWADITYDYDSTREYPMQFNKGVELNGKLYTISGDRGMWRYDGSWKRMAKIPQPDWATWIPAYDTSDIALDIVVHREKIYVIGEKSSSDVLEYDEALDRWNPIDSVIETNDSSYGHLTHPNTPSNRFSLASDGKHLFVSGSNPPWPYVYMGDYGAPYGNEEKGWREVEGNFCPNNICLAHGSTYDMIAVGDTLYAVNKEALLKFPLKDLDETISDQESYPSID